MTFSSGEIVFNQDDPATAFYFVLEGWAVVFREGPDGGRTAIHLVEPGESFAQAALAREARYPASAEAATDLRVARIDTTRFRDLIVQSPELALSIPQRTYHGGGVNPAASGRYAKRLGL